MTELAGPKIPPAYNSPKPKCWRRPKRWILIGFVLMPQTPGRNAPDVTLAAMTGLSSKQMNISDEARTPRISGGSWPKTLSR